VVRDQEGGESFAVLHPSKAYLVVDHDTAPDDWVGLSIQAEAKGLVQVLGFIIEADGGDG